MVFLQPANAQKLHRMPNRATRALSVRKDIFMTGYFFKRETIFLTSTVQPSARPKLSLYREAWLCS